MNAPERLMRTLQAAFLISVLLLLFVAIQVPSKAVHPPDQTVELVIAVLALIDLALGFAVRPFLRRTAKQNSARAGTGSPLGQWFSANVVSLAMIESCALFGLVLHMLGSSTKIAGTLFGACLLALLVWRPGSAPVAANASGIVRN